MQQKLYSISQYFTGSHIKNESAAASTCFTGMIYLQCAMKIMSRERINFLHDEVVGSAGI